MQRERFVCHNFTQTKSVNISGFWWINTLPSELCSYHRGTRREKRNTNQVISNVARQCLRQSWKTGSKPRRAYRCGAGSSAATLSGLAVKPGEEGNAGAARSGCAVPAPCPPLWGWSEWLGAALAAVTCTCWVSLHAYVQGEWKVWVLLLLCHISAAFDNRKGSRIIITEETGTGRISNWAGVDQFCCLTGRNNFHHSHGLPGHFPVEPAARTNLRLAGVL